MKKIISIVTVLFLAMSLLLTMSACAVEEGEKIPENEIWVYNVKELNRVLTTLSSEKKIVLKETGAFTGDQDYDGKQDVVQIYGDTSWPFPIHLYGENKVEVGRIEVYKAVHDLTIENITFKKDIVKI